MNDETNVLIMFICILCIGAGFWAGNFAAQFSIPTMKVWNSNRTYDHILIADDVICKPSTEVNASYYNYEVVAYNNTEYLYKKTRIGNTTAKGIVVCK